MPRDQTRGNRALAASCPIVPFSHAAGLDNRDWPIEAVEIGEYILEAFRPMRQPRRGNIAEPAPEIG